jgi:Transposase domain (DUF772)
MIDLAVAVQTKGFGCVSMIDPFGDGVPEFGNAAEDASAYSLASDLGEQALNKVKPGRGCRGEAALAELSRAFAKLYARDGRPSIPPERLLRALLLQAFYTVRSELQLMEQLNYNLLFRWFVGLSATIRYGMRPCSARTGIGCSTAILPVRS